jgi:hypothetical protein
MFVQCRRCYQYMVVNLDPRAFEVLPTIDEPLASADEQHNCEGNDAVIHVASCYRKLRREHKQNCRNNDIGDAEQVGEPCEELWELEVTVLRQHSPPTHTIDRDWDRVAYAQCSHACRRDSVEGRRASEKDASKDNYHK